MAIHKILENEIEKLVKSANQPKVVSERIINWLKDLSEGNDTDKKNKEWITLILKDLKVKDQNED